MVRFVHEGSAASTAGIGCFDELLNTLIHEALHDTARVDGEFLTCDEEHEVMFLLGDRTYW